MARIAAENGETARSLQVPPCYALCRAVCGLYLVALLAIMSVTMPVARAQTTVEASGSVTNRNTRPSIVLLLVDDLGYECLGANGSKSFQTPAVDQLAAGGVRFAQAYVQPNCTPTRVALMTGKVNARNYVHFGVLEESQRTFGNLFQAAGYATAIIGKWQLGGSVAAETPRRFGFEEYCLYHIKGAPKARNEEDGYASRYINPGLVINGEAKRFKHNAYAPDICNEFALDYITRHKAQPFFLYYPMMLTHAPFDPTPDSSDYPGKRGPKRTATEHYRDMVAYNDKLIAKLIAKLDAEGLREHTFIVFLGDNGTPPRITTEMKDGTTLRGGKGSTTRAGMHVPLVVSWPARIKGGQVREELVSVTDILPTLFDAAGVALSPDFLTDGRSLLPQLLGKPGKTREWIYSWFNPLMDKKSETVEMAFNRDYKLYRTGKFYDLRKDPGEQSPLDVTGLNGDPAQNAKVLQAALDEFKGVRSAEIEARARSLRGFGGKE
jgi:arylsulfatase A